MSEWRILGPKERKLLGDEYITSYARAAGLDAWTAATPEVLDMVNKTPALNNEFRFRRRVSPVAKNATTQESSPVNDRHQIAPLVIADIQKRIEKGTKQYGEPLTSRNGRDALQDAYEEAMDLALYLKQELTERESLKQRAEKAEDGLDLIYSASGQEHGTPDTVVAGIRHMRLKIDEFIAARQQAEKERDEARIEAANYKAYGESIKSELVSTEKERDQLRQSREQRARELLEAAQEYVRHAPICLNNVRHPCDCGLRELQNQIEEHLK